MHLAHLRLRDFRNYARLDVDFAPGFQLLLGDNAQGKTNILEAIYLLATLRSFRGVGGAQMIRHGQKGYFAGATVVGQGRHVGLDAHELGRTRIAAHRRVLEVAAHPMSERVADEAIQLACVVRGGGGSWSAHVLAH